MDKNYYEQDYDKKHDCECTKDDCIKVGYHYANISVPIELTPNTTLGDVVVECCGDPTVECCESKGDKKCNVTITQKVSIKIPVCYQVTACMGETKCDCVDECCKDY